MIGMSSGQVEFDQQFVQSPVYLTEGLAGAGGVSPLTDYLPASAEDAAFASFDPSSGAQLNSWQYAKFPFANQSVAANAAIKQPLTFAICMICPWINPGDAFTKQSVMIALRATLDNHVGLGGTFTVVTPTAVYLNALFDLLHDVTQNERSGQRQTTFEFMFEVPLITLQDASAAAQNQQTQMMTAGVPLQGDPPTATPGADPSNQQGQSAVYPYQAAAPPTAPPG